MTHELDRHLDHAGHQYEHNFDPAFCCDAEKYAVEAGDITQALNIYSEHYNNINRHAGVLIEYRGRTGKLFGTYQVDGKDMCEIDIGWCKHYAIPDVSRV